HSAKACALRLNGARHSRRSRADHQYIEFVRALCCVHSCSLDDSAQPPLSSAHIIRTMATIKQDDFIQSVADALQYISYYHPADYIRNLARAYELEESPAARDAMTQILVNSRMCAEGHRPICQDTGIVTVFLKIGMDVRWDARMTVEEMVNEGVRRAYLNSDNKLRASILADPAG